MNFKTTLALGTAVLVLSLAYLLWERPSPDGIANGNDNTATGGTEGQVSDLPGPPFTADASLSRMEWKLANKPALVFERIDQVQDKPGVGEWQLLEPVRCPATNYRVNDLASTMKNLKLISKLSVSEMSLERAGLRPDPVGRLMATSSTGETATLEIGQGLIGQTRTYVHLADHPQDVFIAEGDFRNILDTPASQYRELKLFKVSTPNAVELEVVEKGKDQTTTYQLRKQDGDWIFVSPFKAKADQKKLRDVVNAFNTIRAATWLDEAPASLAEFGLDQPYLQVKLTTEEKIKKPKPAKDDAQVQAETQPVADSEEGPAQAEEEIKRQEFALLLSDRKPLDDDKQVYVRRGEDQQVGTVLVVDRDKFVPRVNEWRDAKIGQLTAAQAGGVEIRLPNETIELELRGKEWHFAGRDELAESPEVVDLLAAVDALKAVSFVDVPPSADMGLDTPAAELTLSVPDKTDVETIRVGAFTEQVEKRLRYVQRDGSPSVAKARATDVEKLLRGSQVYRNREITDFADSRLLKIELSRLLPASGRTQSIALARDENKVWKMTAPAQADVDLKTVNELVTTLARMRGRRIVEEVNPARLGLLTPDLQLTITVEGTPTVKPAEGPEPGASETLAGEPVIRRVNISKYEGAIYAHRVDRPGFMDLDPAIYDALMAELLPGDIWSFEASQVTALGITSSERTVELKKADERWQYSAEPDIPIDTKKVEEHIKKLRELKTARFVEYAGSNLADYGLDSPTHRFVVELEGQDRLELLISGMPYRGEGSSYYAALADGNRIFALPPAVLDLISLKLADFEKTN